MLALKEAGRRYKPDMLAGVPRENKDE